MKPWEETWDVAMPAATIAAWDGEQPKCGVAVPWRTIGGASPDDDDVARMKLASAAPDMARLLVENEWEGPLGRCPSCNGGRYDDGHAATCALLAALVKAGIR